MFFAKIIHYIRSKIEGDPIRILAVMDQKVKQDTDFLMYFYQTRWFDITAVPFNAA